MNRLKNLVTGTFAVGGLALLLGCSDKKDVVVDGPVVSAEPITELVSEEKSGNLAVKKVGRDSYEIVLAEDVEDSTEYSFEANSDSPRFGRFDDGIYSVPIDNTGQTLELSIFAEDDGENAGLTKLIVYEKFEGKESIVYSSEEDFGHNLFESVDVFHDTAGERIYHAQITDKDGNVVNSKSITMSFTGELMDKEPYTLGLRFFEDDMELDLSAGDLGDNKGLKEMRFYKDGEVFMTVDCEGETRCAQSISLKDMYSPGRHLVKAEIEDLGGNVRTTDSMVLNFKY